MTTHRAGANPISGGLARHAAACVSLLWATLALSSTMAAQSPADPCEDVSVISVWQQPSPPGTPSAQAATTHIEPFIRRLIGLSYPELGRAQVRVRAFRSNYDYFRTRFSYSRFFLFRRMRYFVEVNPRLLELNPPPDGVCAILGHELAHIGSMNRGNRLRLFALVRLASAGYTTRFERKADMEAIRRGFGPGLKRYREWVYRNIPPETVARKKRDYLTPEEIDDAMRRNGGL